MPIKDILKGKVEDWGRKISFGSFKTMSFIIGAVVVLIGLGGLLLSIIIDFISKKISSLPIEFWGGLILFAVVSIIWLNRRKIKELGAGFCLSEVFRFFKKNLSIPASWIVFHLIFYVIFPQTSNLILTDYIYWLICLELSFLSIYALLSVSTDFEKRFSRKAMFSVFCFLIVFLIGGIFGRVYFGQEVAKIEWLVFHKTTNSNIDYTYESIEKNHQKQQIEPLVVELKQLQKKKNLSEEDLARAKQLKKELQVLGAVPREKRTIPLPEINWPEFNFWDKPKKPKKTVQIQRQEKVVNFGVYVLPPDGSLISTTVDGRQIRCQQGQYLVLERRDTTRGSFWLENGYSPYPPLEVHQRAVKTRAVFERPITLSNRKGGDYKIIAVRVKG